MTPVDMNAVHFYKPGEAAGRRKVGRQAVSSSRVSMARGKGNILSALGPDKEWSGIFLDDDPIEILDMTGPLPEEPFNLFQVQARDLDNTEKDVEETFNGLDTSRTYGRSGVEENDNLPNIEELLFGARNAQEWWQSTGSSNRQVTGGSEGNLEHAAKNNGNVVASPGSSKGEKEKKSVLIDDNRLEDCNTQDAQQEADGSIYVQTYNLTPDGKDNEREAVRLDKSIGTHDHDTRTDEFITLRKLQPAFKIPPTLKPNEWDNRANSFRNEPGSPGDPIVVQDQDIDSSSDGASEKQGGNQGSLSTPLTSVAGSDAGYSTLNQKNKHDTPYTSPSNRDIHSSMLGKRTRGFNGGNREGPTPDSSTDGDKKIPCNGQEAEADDKKEDEEKYIGDGGEKTTPLEFTKKRGPFAVEGKSASKRPVKRRRCSSPILAVHDQNHDAQADGSSPETKGVKTKIRRATISPSPASDSATSPPTLEQAREQGDKAQVEELEWGVKKILDKRETMSGTEFKVRWEDTWLPIDELGHAWKLLQEFEAQRRAQHGHKRGRPAGIYKLK